MNIIPGIQRIPTVNLSVFNLSGKGEHNALYTQLDMEFVQKIHNLFQTFLEELMAKSRRTAATHTQWHPIEKLVPQNTNAFTGKKDMEFLFAHETKTGQLIGGNRIDGYDVKFPGEEKPRRLAPKTRARNLI
ncbi:MAG: hypothetical protein WC289_02850 [Patescibacteria group bacterium]